MEEEQLNLRVDGDPTKPTLIYLPGLHGDWTLVGSFKRALGNRAQLITTTYPRTLTWSLDDYAANVESTLTERGITRGWLLGESFSSQVVWAMVARGLFQIEGIVLAGGFVRHPVRAGVRLAQRIAHGISLSLLTRIMFGYAKFARFRYRHSPETMADIQEFIRRRTELDRQAAVHRLRLIAQSDFCDVVRATNIPIYAISGVLDPVVPWFFVRRWLRKNCPALRDYRIVYSADHNILGTAPDAAADQVTRWINASDTRNLKLETRNRTASRL
jgi:pimeloyl-ACP methyl ester carboxylesterase